MNRLKELRSELKIALRELEKYTGISFSVIAYLENEQRPFRQAHIESLTNFFGVTSDFLLGRSDIGYQIKTEYGEDELIFSETEYKNFSDHITKEIINVGAFGYEIKTQKEIFKSYHPAYKVYRELKGKITDYNLQETIFNKYVELGKHLTSEELNKAINFIEDYILR